MLLFLQMILWANGYTQDTRQIVLFKDKGHNPYSLNRPNEYLSQKAINRRARQHLSVDSSDLPVTPDYLNQLLQVEGVHLLNVSKWLNQALIQISDPSAIQNIQSLPFVNSIRAIAPRIKQSIKKDIEISPPVRRISGIQGGEDYYNYGNMYSQIHLHEGEFLHNKGFRGEGMTIAIIDAGFFHYDTNPAFDSVRLNNQILGTWDFVEGKSSVTEAHLHGMICFSTIAANRPGIMVGSAPKANFYLFRTENVDSEYPTEEQNWVAAAEKADSLGVDLISSSLGYNTFDNASMNHTYADMDGKTTIITRGAEWAVKKGIFVTNSAGNSGKDRWRYIVAPADGEHVLTIGAVNGAGQVADFSSYGPSYDGRIKPNVASLGWGAIVAGTNGNPITSNGTSLANPNLAGLITCLWQAFPEFTSAEIFDVIQKSANQYTDPDDRIGYGIPNMRVAYTLLERKREIQNAETILEDDYVKVYPIPFQSNFQVLVKPNRSGRVLLTLYNAIGSKLVTKTEEVHSGTIQFINFNHLNNLPAGLYWLHYFDGKDKRIIRLVK